MQFDLSNLHQESDLWFCWIVGQFFCLMYPLKLGDNFCQNRCSFCASSEIQSTLLEVQSFWLVWRCGQLMQFNSWNFVWCLDLLEYWIRLLFESMVWSFSPAWEAVELTKESCIHLFVRGPRPDLGATIVAPGHMLGDFLHPRRSLLPFMISH